MMRFESMETFVQVVEAGSITAAAEHMGIAKSAVSRRLSELEERLGVQLFHRTTRRMNLTGTGRSLYERCVNILADVAEAEQAVSREHGNLQGHLRVALPLSFGLLQLGPAINAFLQAHPGVEFDLDFNDRQVDLLAEGFDLALRIGDLEDSSLIARRLARIRSCVCASPAYLQRAGTPRRPEELAHHACLTYSLVPEPRVWRYHDAAGKAGSVRVASRLQANNGDFLHRAALEGQGIVLQPLFIVHRSLAEGRLLPLLTEYEWPATSAHALYPHTRHLSHRVRAFIDFLSAWFTEADARQNGMGF